MPIDKLDGTLTIRSRDQIRDDWLRDYRFRLPSADVGKNSSPWVDASASADAKLPIYANTSRLADATSFTNARGTLLSQYASDLGRDRRAAVGGIGYVVIEAATGGGSILAGSELRYPSKGTRYQVVTSDVYQDGDLCAIQGIDTGAQTNLEAGAVLQWLSPPPGILGTCEVFENTDGSGITGGAEEESDEDLIEALKTLFSEPAASGNDADVIQFVERLQGIAIQKCFCYPCVGGPGEYAVAFTMRPDVPGASRLPNAAHIARVEAEVKAAFPGDDGVLFPSMLEHSYAVCVKVRWRTDVTSFVDTVPWPPYAASKVTVKAAPAPTVSSCRVQNATTAPSIGKNVAFYDSTTRTFKNKRILTVTAIGGNDYDLTFDLTGNASDPSFLPTAGAILSPWATDMTSLVDPLLAYGDLQGPGEMVATFSDPGRRQRRIPEPTPDSWPSSVSNSILDDVFELVADATLAEPTTPFATTTGTLGTLVYLHRISDIGIFSL